MTEITSGMFFKHPVTNDICRVCRDKNNGRAWLVDIDAQDRPNRVKLEGTLLDIAGYVERQGYVEMPFRWYSIMVAEDYIMWSGRYFGKMFALTMYHDNGNNIGTVRFNGAIIEDGKLRPMDAVEVGYVYGIVTGMKVLSSVEFDSTELRKDILVRYDWRRGFNEAMPRGN